MLEKIKQFGEAAKTILEYIAAPIVAIAVFIVYLLSAKRRAEEDLAIAKANSTSTQVEGEIKDAKAQTQVDYAKFMDELAEYQRKHGTDGLRPSPKTVHEGNTRSEKDSGTSGPGNKG